MNEIWKPVVGFEGYYEVSNLNQVRSVDRYVEHPKGGLHLIKGKILKPKIHKTGYQVVNLCKNGIYKTFKVHRLVAEAFIPNPHNLPEVNHKDENKLNNRPENLEWCDHKYNNNYGTAIERMTKKLSTPILQLDLQGNFIKEWSSAREAGRNGFSHSVICDCCKGKFKKHKGYIWKYKE